jgi:FkbM family methyltransferase
VAPSSVPRAASAAELDRLLSLPTEDWLGRAAAEIPGPDDPVVLIGAGGLGRQVARKLSGRDRVPIAFLDETPALLGQEIDGIPVLTFDEAVARLATSAWFAVTIWNGRHRYLDSRARLIAAGCTQVCSFLDLAWSEPEALLPHYGFDLPGATLEHRNEIESAFGILAGEADREEFLTHLRFRLGRDYAALPQPSSTTYLDPGLIGPLERVTYVDGGAYDGDTLLAVLARFAGELEAALLFEPDRRNYERLLETVSGLTPEVRSRVHCFEAALAERDGQARLAASGSEASAISEAGEQPTELRRIDTALGDTARGPILIKLDVEGYEEAAIRGAEGTIKSTAPVVVACLYHRPADLWRIPLLLHGYRPDYQLHIRTESTDGAGLICYAVPATAG